MLYSTFESVFTLFVLILLGFYLRKRSLLDGDITRGFIQLLLHYTLPAMIVVSMQQSITEDLLRESLEMFGISLLSYGLFGILAWVFTLLIRAPKDEAGVYRFVFVFSNVGFMGYPVIGAVLGDTGVFYAAIFNIPFHFLAFSLGVFLLTKGKGEEKIFTWKLLFSPPMIATLLGFLFFLTGIQLPSFIAKPLDLLGSLTTPLSMITIGSLLAVLPLRHLASDRRLFTATAVRLILIPLILWGVLRLRYDGFLLFVPVLVASMPAAANAPILSEKYGGKGTLASQLVFVSTLFSLISIPLWSYFLLKGNF